VQFQTLISALQQLSLRYGYFGVFFTSLLGAVSLFIPIPDTSTLFALAGLKIDGSWVFDPLIIAAVATIGAGIGQFSGYIVGVRSKMFLTGKYKKNADFLARAFKKFGSVGIFAFALTPLPDDLMFVPLGMARYNPVKAFVPSLAGNFFLSLLIVFASRFSISIIANAFGAGGSLLSFIISGALGIVLTVTMFKIDWTKHFGKYIK
jgi:membrane protein DedA with SNARE-associated domain